MSRQANLREQSVFPKQIFGGDRGSTRNTSRLVAAQTSGGGIGGATGTLSYEARVVITSNIALSGALSSGNADGVTLATGDVILLVGQSTASQNGPYNYNPDLPAYQRTTHSLVDGMSFAIKEGSLFAGTSWRCVTSDPIVKGTTATVWRQNDSILLHAYGNTLHRGPTPISGSGYGMFNITSTSGDGVPLIITNEDTGAAIDITASGATSSGVKVTGTGLTYAFEANNNPVAFYAIRNSSGASGAMVQVYQQHASNTSDVVEFYTDGGGRVLNLYNNSNSGAGAAAFVSVSQLAADFAQNALAVSTAATGAYHGISVSVSAATNTGAAINAASAGGSGASAGKFSSTTAAYSIHATKNGTTGRCVLISQLSASNTADALYVEHGGGGKVAYFFRDTHGGSEPVVSIENNDAADDQATCEIVNAGTGYGLDVVNSDTGTTDSTLRVRNNGSGVAIEAISSATNAVAVDSQGIAQTFSLKGAGSAPTLAGGVGAGTAPTLNISGTDLGGRIDVTTGTGPAASATVVTVNFDVTQGNAPSSIILSPANPAAAALTGGAQVFANQPGGTTGTWTIDVGTAGLAASTAYQWSYMVIL